MKKYLPFVAVLIFIVSLLVYSTYVGAEKEEEKEAAAYEAERHILVYSTLPSDVNRELEQDFYRQHHLHVTFQTQTEDQFMTQAMANPQQHPDVVIAAEPTLKEMDRSQLLHPYESEQTAMVPDMYKDAEGAWTGLWLNPMVFIVSQDYYIRQGMHLNTWDDLLTDPQITIAFPDLASMDMAGDFLCSFVEMRGSELTGLYLRALQSHITFYSKSMSAIARRVAGGEADVGVIDGTMARQFRSDGVPFYIVYPADGTSYWLTGVAVTEWNHDEELANLFVSWLFSPEADRILRKNHLYFTYTSNRSAQSLDDRGQALTVFPVHKNYTITGRKALQDWWIKSVRFGKE